MWCSEVMFSRAKTLLMGVTLECAVVACAMVVVVVARLMLLMVLLLKQTSSLFCVVPVGVPMTPCTVAVGVLPLLSLLTGLEV